MIKMNSIGRENAIKLANSKWYENKTPYEIVKFQLFTKELCMPFDLFHSCLEKTLKREIFTHEFAINLEGIMREFLGEKEAPSFKEIVNLIPKDKLIILDNLDNIDSCVNKINNILDKNCRLDLSLTE